MIDREPRFLSSEAARLIALQRQPKEKHCLVCGEPFTTIGRGLYDKRACQQKAYLFRKKGQPLPFGTHESHRESGKTPELSFAHKIRTTFQELNLTPQETIFAERLLIGVARFISEALKESRLPKS